MLSNYHWKMFTSYSFSMKINVRLYQKGIAVELQPTYRKNNQAFIPENVYLILNE